ncbi:MAG: glycosyltransferase [Brucella intermedia]
MKIILCIYQDSERAGGSVRVAEVIVRTLLRSGVDVHVAVAYGKGGRIKQLLGEKCHLLTSTGWKDPRGWLRYRRLLRKIKPDIVHYADGVGWMVVSAIGLGHRRVMHQHFRPNIGPGGDRRLRRIRWLSGTADKVVAISHGAAKQLTELCGIHPNKIAVIHNAIDDDYLSVGPAIRGSHRRLGMAVRVV